MPDGILPLGKSYDSSTDAAYIGVLRYRGNDQFYGQVDVTMTGDVRIWVNKSVADVDEVDYFYGQVVFPIAS